MILGNSEKDEKARKRAIQQEYARQLLEQQVNKPPNPLSRSKSVSSGKIMAEYNIIDSLDNHLGLGFTSSRREAEKFRNKPTDDEFYKISDQSGILASFGGTSDIGK
jgi:hypothetical protein